MGLGARTVSSLVAGEFNLRGDSSKFLVVIDDGNYDLGSWSKVTGLNVTWDTLEYRVGDRTSIWTAPGQRKFGKISLSRATGMDSAAVQDWLADTARTPKAYSGCIKLLTWAGVPLCEWRMHTFVPIGWKIADFETKAATVVIETLDLAHCGFLADDIHFEATAARPS